MADLIAQIDLERAIGVNNLGRLLDDDGDGAADAANVTDVVQKASSIAKGILKNGWPVESQMEALVAGDPALKDAVINIGVGLCGRRRPEFLDANGRNPYMGWYDRGEKYLREVVELQRRSIAEASVGNNPRIGTRVNVDRTIAPLVFTATKGNPHGPGGF